MAVKDPASNEVTVERMYYTLCLSCGALDDWTDRMPEARRNQREHLKWHKQNIEESA